ncbi:hypothetical protein GWK41_05200 [Persephonella atlantica]|uniref:Magnesium transporter MgtE intracellular domain-containing protein n=1 Tax=Persephonella atlantica TaxID=2699429 RepID=A0ABS1GI83_9AQUI|nr:hypothetical protein [Persephonella atlantica]MBK3332457.1 hypothetical protein [Persephonella atlantica]
MSKNLKWKHSLLTKALIGIISLVSFSFGETKTPSPAVSELQKEIIRLEKLREELKKTIAENKKILEKIEAERKRLEEEKKKLKEIEKKITEERYKKLAKVFEKAVDEDPELAAERMSKMKDPVKAAYIIYNMKESKAGVLMDYIDPKMADKIVRILTQLKKQK